MNLTKDEDKWISHYDLPDDIVDKILKNQEDAEKLARLEQLLNFGLVGCQDDADRILQIVERLKKELPEIYDILDSYDEWGWTTKIKTKLQKILEGKE